MTQEECFRPLVEPTSHEHTFQLVSARSLAAIRMVIIVSDFQHVRLSLEHLHTRDEYTNSGPNGLSYRRCGSVRAVHYIKP